MTSDALTGQATSGADGARAERPPVLDPVERVSEVIFGVLMAMSFTGSISVASDGAAEVRMMVSAAIGCNLAWGITDAVMYLVRVATDRDRRAALVRQFSAADTAAAHRLIAGELPERLAAGVTTETLEALRRNLAGLPPPRRLGSRDIGASVAIFALVALSTFPVVLPFFFIDDPMLALRASNGLSLATLFIGGYSLGRHAQANPLRYGMWMTGIGVVLIAIIIALGG
jgi:hypothetical protein